MHETFLATQIVAQLDRLADEHAPCRITAVRLRVGALQQVVDDLLTFALEVATADGPAAGAAFEIVHEPARCRCKACEAEFEVDDWQYLCPRCESGQVARLSGDELIIENITIEQEEGANADTATAK